MITDLFVNEARARLDKKNQCLKALEAYKVNFDIDVNISGYHWFLRTYARKFIVISVSTTVYEDFEILRNFSSFLLNSLAALIT